MSIYDALAPSYRSYSERKASYITAIDNLIIEDRAWNAPRMLDVGSGDGVRAASIARKIGASELVMIEPSSKMAELCQNLQCGQVIHGDSSKINDQMGKFSVITCLWNVLGHIEAQEERVRHLAKLRSVLSDDGVLYLDVQNRYNAESYGYLEVFRRVLSDYIWPDIKKGDSTFSWLVDGRQLSGMGHLFTPKEVEELIKAANLKVERRLSVHYDTGQIFTSFLKGQLFYSLSSINCVNQKAGLRAPEKLG